MNKKSTTPLVYVFEILLVVAVVGISMKIAHEYANADTVVKTNLAQDLGLMVNVLAGVPGDATVEYPRDVSKYIVQLRSDTVTVWQRDDPEPQRKSFTFHLPANHAAEGTVEEKACLRLIKRTSGDRKTIVLGECP